MRGGGVSAGCAGMENKPKKPTRYRVKSGEMHTRGAGPKVMHANMLENIDWQLRQENLTLETDPRDYLERRRLLMILGMEDIIRRAREMGMLDTERRATMDLLRLTTVHTQRSEVTLVAPSLRQGPNLTKIDEKALLAIEQGDDVPELTELIKPKKRKGVG